MSGRNRTKETSARSPSIQLKIGLPAPGSVVAPGEDYDGEGDDLPNAFGEGPSSNPSSPAPSIGKRAGAKLKKLLRSASFSGASPDEDADKGDESGRPVVTVLNTGGSGQKPIGSEVVRGGPVSRFSAAISLSDAPINLDDDDDDDELEGKVGTKPKPKPAPSTVQKQDSWIASLWNWSTPESSSTTSPSAASKQLKSSQPTTATNNSANKALPPPPSLSAKDAEIAALRAENEKQKAELDSLRANSMPGTVNAAKPDLDVRQSRSSGGHSSSSGGSEVSNAKAPAEDAPWWSITSWFAPAAPVSTPEGEKSSSPSSTTTTPAAATKPATPKSATAPTPTTVSTSSSSSTVLPAGGGGNAKSTAASKPTPAKGTTKPKSKPSTPATSASRRKPATNPLATAPTKKTPPTPSKPASKRSAPIHSKSPPPPSTPSTTAKPTPPLKPRKLSSPLISTSPKVVTKPKSNSNPPPSTLNKNSSRTAPTASKGSARTPPPAAAAGGGSKRVPAGGRTSKPSSVTRAAVTAVKSVPVPPVPAPKSTPAPIAKPVAKVTNPRPAQAAKPPAPLAKPKAMAAPPVGSARSGPPTPTPAKPRAMAAPSIRSNVTTNSSAGAGAGSGGPAAGSRAQGGSRRQTAGFGTGPMKTGMTPAPRQQTTTAARPASILGSAEVVDFSTQMSSVNVVQKKVVLSPPPAMKTAAVPGLMPASRPQLGARKASMGSLVTGNSIKANSKVFALDPIDGSWQPAVVISGGDGAWDIRFDDGRVEAIGNGGIRFR